MKCGISLTYIYTTHTHTHTMCLSICDSRDWASGVRGDYRAHTHTPRETSMHIMQSSHIHIVLEVRVCVRWFHKRVARGVRWRRRRSKYIETINRCRGTSKNFLLRGCVCVCCYARGEERDSAPRRRKGPPEQNSFVVVAKRERARRNSPLVVFFFILAEKGTRENQKFFTLKTLSL